MAPQVTLKVTDWPLCSSSCLSRGRWGTVPHVRPRRGVWMCVAELQTIQLSPRLRSGDQTSDLWKHPGCNLTSHPSGKRGIGVGSAAWGPGRLGDVLPFPSQRAFPRQRSRRGRWARAHPGQHDVRDASGTHVCAGARPRARERGVLPSDLPRGSRGKCNAA